MEQWTFGTNHLPQFRYGSVHLIKMPFWLWLIDQFADRGCSFIPPVPFPNWPKLHFDKDDPEYMGTPKEWFGDLRQLYCCHVHCPLSQWVWSHPKRKEYSFEVGYDKLKEGLGEDYAEYFEELEKQT